jgi:hypothetical protein
MSRALCPCEVMTSHIAVLLGDLFHFSSRIAPKSHSVAPADAQYAPRLAANPRLPERCDGAPDDVPVRPSRSYGPSGPSPFQSQF